MPEDMQERERLGANEQVKLTATLFNNLAGGATIVGFLGPAASSLYNLQLPASPYWLAFVSLWVMLAILLHLLGRTGLKDLAP